MSLSPRGYTLFSPLNVSILWRYMEYLLRTTLVYLLYVPHLHNLSSRTHQPFPFLLPTYTYVVLCRQSVSKTKQTIPYDNRDSYHPAARVFRPAARGFLSPVLGQERPHGTSSALAISPAIGIANSLSLLQRSARFSSPLVRQHSAVLPQRRCCCHRRNGSIRWHLFRSRCGWSQPLIRQCEPKAINKPRPTQCARPTGTGRLAAAWWGPASLYGRRT